MNKGIVGYTATPQGRKILITRAYDIYQDTLLASTWDELSKFLTEDFGEAFHVVWELSSFSNTIFSLLPASVKQDIAKKTRAHYKDTKIFSVDRWLGLTKTMTIHDNFVEKRENNFFGLSHWMPSGTDIPMDAKTVSFYGEEVMRGLDRMGIAPTKLTSPVGVISDELASYVLPTIYSNQDIIDACEFCLPMMRYEWRSAFKLGFFDPVYSYDLTSAYPFFIANLPDTDKCRIQFSNTYIKSDWAIVRGIINVWADISPVVFDTGDGYINPKGEWEGYFTKDEINWLLRRNLGSFKMTEGYFIDWLSNKHPYERSIEKLFAMRDKEDIMVNHLAKRASQGISGKLDQDNQDGSLGELYNPIYAAMTRSRCRLKNADFIYDNNLLDDVVDVQVDGCDSLKEVTLQDNNNMGYWRLDSVSPALIAGKGEIWKPYKKPLNISYDAIIEAMREHPSMSFYQFGDKYLDLILASTDSDRLYNNYPKTGGELLKNTYHSIPIAL